MNLPGAAQLEEVIVTANRRWEVTAWSRNLLDEEY